MTRLILGLNTDHGDSSAALIDENGIKAAICEERINRKKHCADFPILAIQECLKIAGADIRDVTDIAIARDPKANLKQKAAFVARYPRSGIPMLRKRLQVHRGVTDTVSRIAEGLGVSVETIRVKLHRVEHHLAHIASAFYCSPFDRCAGFSHDGAGDFVTTMWALCEGNSIDVRKKSFWPHSPGVFYTAITQFIGFQRYGEEFKVMGLAAYGEDRFASEMREIMHFEAEKGVRLNLSWFQHHQNQNFETITDGVVSLPQLWGNRFIEVFGPARDPDAPLTQRDMDLSASMQARHEDVFLATVRQLTQMTDNRNVVMAGGCALNSVANGRMITEGFVDRAYFQSAGSDDGTALGGALQVMHGHYDLPRTGPVTSSYWGTAWTDDEIESAVKRSGYRYQKLDRAALIASASQALADGLVMGWFQGREEWGPRALGNRSIVCNPGWPDMKAILNSRVKNREEFRPFAPAVRIEDLSEVFEGSHEVPSMIVVYKVREEWRDRVPAVTHEDGTGRVQTVDRSDNALFYDLIGAFRELTSIPVVLNTSFNENEPIVHTPAQAIACFDRTHMDRLAIGSFWLAKPAGPDSIYRVLHND